MDSVLWQLHGAHWSLTEVCLTPLFLHILQTDCPKAECFETLPAMELAEQITLLDHIIFRSIPYE